jgi:DNA-binding transcriptional LysR family regulator
MYDDLFLFIKVAKFGSFTKAAKELNIYQSTISRRIISLEEYLGVKLIVRTANHFELTNQGKQLFESLSDEEAVIQNKMFSSFEKKDDMFGELKIMLPQSISLKIITLKLPEFMAKYPRLKLRLHYKNNDINLQKDYIDLAVIFGLPDQPSQKIKLVHRGQVVVFCTPKYVEKYGFLREIDEISNHNVLSILRDHGEIINRVNIKDTRTNKISTITLDNKIASNSFIHNLALVDSGEFISASYAAVLHDDFKTGKYVKLLPDYKFDELDFYMLKRIEDDPRINAFADFIEECFKEYNETS